MTSKKLVLIFFLMLFIQSSLCLAGTPVKVVSVKPKGELKGIWQGDQIAVTFNTAIVQLERIEQFRPQWFIIEPQIEGDFQWIGTQTLAFKPTGKLPYATEFKVTIKSGLTATNGSKLGKDYRWSFQTPTPFVRYTHPRNKEKSVDTKITVALHFNIPVLPSALSQYLEFYEYRNKRRGKSIEYVINDGAPNASNKMMIKPVKELDRDTEYIIIVHQGLPASEGNLGSKVKWRSSFRTYAKFEFLGINRGDRKPINPKKSITLNFSNPVEYSELIKHTKFEPAIDLKDYGYSYRQSIVHIYGPFLPDTTYRIFISNELTDIFGNKLQRAIADSFTTRSYDPKYKIPAGESILESYGDLNIPLEMVNLQKLQAKVKIVSLDSLDILGTWFNKRSKYSHKDILGKRFNRVDDIISQIRKNKRMIVPFNLKKYLSDGKFGILLLQFYGKEQGDLPRPYKLMLIQATSLGITAKFSPVSNAIYVTELKTGSPVKGVNIQIRDGTGKVYWTGITDESGYCESPGWQRLGMPATKNIEPVQWVVAIVDNDVAFTHSQRGTGISPWEFRIPYQWRARDEQLEGAIFTDRGIYRAEDTVRVKVVLREKYGLEWHLTSRDSFQVMIDDPVGKQVYAQYHHLNEFNAFDFKFPLPYDAKRGYYGIRVIVPQKLSWEYSIYESFWVEDYRPAEFEVTVHPQKTEYIFGDTLKASISASYLFGAPLKNAPIRWTLTKSHYFHTPPRWDGYYFNPQRFFHGKFGGIGTFSSYTVSNQDYVDDTGTIQIVHFPQEPDLLTSAKYIIEGEVTDQNRRKIAGRKAVTIFRGEYQIGIKPKSFFGEKQKSYPIFIITTDPDGNLVPQQKVKLQIVRRNWYSVRKAGTGGRYYWQSEVTDSTVIDTAIISGIKPVTFNFLPPKSGYYLMRATSFDARGNKIVADCSFYIIGKDYVAWKRSDDDRIELEKDKQKYKPGAVATIMIKSPFEQATALVTIEREGIIDHFTQQVIGSTPTIKIPIRNIYLPNVYVSVMLIQGRIGNNMFSKTGEDIAKPAFKLGYINLPVAIAKKKLAVMLSTDKQTYKPGESVTVNIKALDWEGNGERSEIILAVVDKGVLNLIGYRFPNLHEYFYRNRPLSVTTSESRLNIIGQRNYGEKGEDRGGAGGIESMALFQIRKDFKTTAYWNPSIITNQQGMASVTFQLPDNLTTFIIMAAVHNKASEFGNGEQSFKVSKPLVLKPALPRFIRYQDVFKAGVVIHNYSDRDGKVTIEVKAVGVQSLDRSNRIKINLTAGESREVRFLFKANQLNKAEFTFKAMMGLETDAVLTTIPVHKPLTYELVASANNSVKKSVEKIIVPQNCYSEMSTLEIKAAATQLIGMSDGVTYLFDYPYGCLEQKLSRILPMILFGDVIDAFNILALKGTNYQQAAQKFFDQLSDFQTPMGGFTYWPKTGNPNPYVSAWTMFALIKGKQADYKISKDLLKNGTKYLQDVLHNQINKDLYPYTWNYWSVTNCLILYDLALQKKADHAYIEKLYQHRERVPLFGLGYLLKAMKYAKSNPTMYQTIKEIVLNGLMDTATTAHFEEPDETGLEWCFHSNVRTTAHILQSLLELKEQFPQAAKVVTWLLLKRNMSGTWRSTQENIYVLHALNTYFKEYEKNKPDFRLEVKLAQKKIIQALYQGYSFSQHVANLDLKSYRAGQELALEFDKRGTGRYYYETRLKYYPREPLPATDQGISIIKKWKVVEGEQLEDGSIAAGSVVKVNLTVATSMERNYVVVDDPLPAGFEVINTKLKTVSESYRKYEPLKLNSSYWGGFNFYELHDDKVLVFADNLPAGIHSFVYLCQALTAGDFNMPATKAEQMYSPEVFGRTKDEEIVIR